jgi:2-oxoglutarate dehydrogenase complex dehydrogenase (E1) component-like enzyme
MTPKSLLRHPQAVSTIDELSQGRFEPVLTDLEVTDARRVILTTGKVYYDLVNARGEARDIAIVRLEQFYPWPAELLVQALNRTPNATEVVWVQEEPRNMGAWRFVEERLRDLVGNRTLRYVGRPIAASPATGSHRRHEQQQQALIQQALS